MKRLTAILIAALMLTACSPRQPVGLAPPQNPPAYENPQSESAPPPVNTAPEPPARYTLTLTVLEGYTLARIGRTLEEMGVATEAEFIEAAQAGDFSEFPLVAAMPQNPERFFPLEGYLFPGMYEIYPDEPPESIIRRMLAATEEHLGENLRREIAESGRTVDELLILASIVQAESLGNDDAKPLVSAVIHNRLRTGMMLQMCKTSFYVRDYIAPIYEGDPARFHGHYNTYMFHGLPVGPICNPGPSAIRAALSPAQADYFFYIWDDDGGFHFAVSWEEHQANVQRYLR